MALTLDREVLRWLQSLDLSFAVKDARRDLASGYVVAEAVSRYHLDLPLHAFDQSHALEHKRANWGQLLRFFAGKGLMQGVTRGDVEELIHGNATATAAFVGALYECLTGRRAAAEQAEQPAGGAHPRAAAAVPSFARPTAATVAAAASRQPAVEAISDDRLRAVVVGAAVAQYEQALVVDRLQNPQRHAGRGPGGAQARRAAASLARRQLQQGGPARGGGAARGASPPRGGASGWR